MNPFIEFARDPVEVLATIAYAFLLLGTTIAVAGVMWSTALRLSNVWEYRNVDGRFGPSWTYVPPMTVILRVSGLCVLLSLEALLFGALIWLVT